MLNKVLYMSIQTDLAVKHGEEGTLHVEREELLRLVQVGRRRPVQRLRGGPLEPRAGGQGLRRVTRRPNVTLQDLKAMERYMQYKCLSNFTFDNNIIYN